GHASSRESLGTGSRQCRQSSCLASDHRRSPRLLSHAVFRGLSGMSSTPRRAPTRPYKPRDAAVTSRMMSAVRGKDSKAEIAIRKALWSRGLRYRLHRASLPGRPDLVFSRYRSVLFVDSDFWHARALVEGDEETFRSTIRGQRQEWWVAKLT